MPRTRARLAAIIILASVAPAAARAADAVIPMVDPDIDTTGPFCYLAKPNFNLGVIGNRHGAQVTFDGAIYSGGSELCFFTGSKLRPVMARQKTLEDGWMPIVHYGCTDGAVRYDIEAFGASLDGDTTDSPVSFVRVDITNTGTTPTVATFAAASRFLVDDHRFGYMKPYTYSPEWRYEMTRDSLLRDGRLVYTYPPGGRREAVPGTPYTRPFRGRDHKVWERAEVGLVRYDIDLPPGASKHLVFKAPMLPPDPKDTRSADAIRRADYGAWRARTAAAWADQVLGQGSQFLIPEKKVAAAQAANLMLDLIAIWTRDGHWVPGVNKTQYNWFWLRDGAYIVRTYDMLGQHNVAAKCLEYFLTFHKPDGSFSSQDGQLDGFGQALFALGQHYFATGDRAFADRVYGYFPPAIAWLKKQRAADQYHLLPSTNVQDNEFISGRYTGHNFWALTGVRMAARMAQALGHDDDARAFRAEYDDYRTALLNRLDEVCGKDGPLPPGLDAPGGQDWGNLIGVYPSEVLAPDDAHVSATLAKMHREKYAEGLMTYKGRLHHYLTIKEAQNHVVRGEQEQALEDFYQWLLHTDSCHAGFEWETDPWGARDVGTNYPPHGWGSAMFNALLRNMLVREAGGDGGLGPRDLHLFSVVSPEWARTDRGPSTLAFHNAATELGPVSASLIFQPAAAVLAVEANYRTQPASVVVHIPYFKDLDSFDSNATSATRRADAIVFSPDVTSATLHWRDRPGARMISFDSTVADYRKEYARRYKEYVAAGHKPVPVEAPRMLTTAERERGFDERWAPAVTGLAVGKPVRVSGGTQKGHPPERAVDGITSDPMSSSWWADGPGPRWLEVDLTRPEQIGAILVFPLWDGSRSYQYTVEVSPDGRTWNRVADMTTNTRAATENGDRFDFPKPLTARYVRVTLLQNTANPALHLVELRVLPGT